MLANLVNAVEFVDGFITWLLLAWGFLASLTPMCFKCVYQFQTVFVLTNEQLQLDQNNDRHDTTNYQWRTFHRLLTKKTMLLMQCLLKRLIFSCMHSVALPSMRVFLWHRLLDFEIQFLCVCLRGGDVVDDLANHCSYDRQRWTFGSCWVEKKISTAWIKKISKQAWVKNVWGLLTGFQKVDVVQNRQLYSCSDVIKIQNIFHFILNKIKS